MRKVSFVVFDIDNSIKDRFNLDYITDLSGVGFGLKLSKLEGDIYDTLTKVVQEKQEIKFKIHFINRPYEKSAVLEQWIKKYSSIEHRLGIEYTDGVITRWTEGKVTKLTKNEKDEFGQLIREVTFTCFTSLFNNIEHRLRIKMSEIGKAYPYTYPYCYGNNAVENNEIDNTAVLDVPVTVTISGSIYEPTILLLDENKTEYSRVKFTGLTLAEGQRIIINSASSKIYFDNGAERQDYTSETDPNYDTFLWAKRGKSSLSINLQAGDTGELSGSWRQF
jgi:hypothetical protein